MKYCKKDGWNEKRVFEYAKQHLITAGVLFENQVIESYMFSIYSAGYLCHLGVELLLKGCWLHESDYFKNEHNLNTLNEYISFLQLDDYMQTILSNLQLFNEMRYPQNLSKVKLIKDLRPLSNLQGEIGDHDWVGTIELLHEVQRQMPDALRQTAEPVFSNFKDTLNKKKYLKEGKYLYRLVLAI